MKDSPVILALETATLGGSVCLTRGNTMLAARIGDPETSHSNSLLSDVNKSLEHANILLSDVDLFACASGPGSFTGLRIGLATVKALAITVGRPCVGISTLQAIARTAGLSRGTVALLPAGRGEVFVQFLSVTADGSVVERDSPAHLSPHIMLDRYSGLGSITWAGPGAQVHRELIRSYAAARQIAFSDNSSKFLAESGWSLAPEADNIAEHVAGLALLKLQCGETADPHRLTANYVRPADAAFKEQCR